MTMRIIIGLLWTLTATTCNTASTSALSPPSTGARVCENEMIAAAREHNVPLPVLYSVGLTESGRRGQLHPFALNIEGRSVFPQSLREGLEAFSVARRNGVKLIDLGCMQINHHYHGLKFGSIAEMFDPKKNIRYAALFLKRLRDREGSWTLAVARYHAGPNNNAAQHRYVCAIITNMVASGLGQWTPAARKFCGSKASLTQAK